MSDDGALFGDDEPAPEPKSGTTPQPRGLADWQVSQLRSALDTSGVTEMTARRQLVERLVGRPVPSLRDLTFSEAIELHQELRNQVRSPASKPPRSSWEDRSEDTWIDRL